MKTVKIGDEEYKQMKALAKNKGYILQYLLNVAIRQFLAKRVKP